MLFNVLMLSLVSLSFSGGLAVKSMPSNAVDPGNSGLILIWDDPLEKGMATHSSILAWRIPMDTGARQATVHGVTKIRTGLSN